jgi:hypothetical protein
LPNCTVLKSLRKRLRAALDRTGWLVFPSWKTPWMENYKTGALSGKLCRRSRR